jgi:asparagine synthase (glutamine-hydrolysing)
MCGIAGVLRVAETRATDTEEAVGRMTGQLQHRGPDACGLDVFLAAQSAQVGLGHTRLAIIDLSPAGRQPMRSADGRCSLTFNGEIYNYRALRDALGPRQWRSRTDTEVLLEGYAAYGRSFVERLRGMFAFGLWDDSRQELFLARDRLGIKPLYYYAADGVFIFASEVRALLASGLVPRRIDPFGVADYLTYQSLPAPRTMIEGVRSLPPGSWLIVDADGRLHEQRYWDLLQDTPPAEPTLDRAAAQQRVGDLLHEAVASHLVSDVPVGAFLSGGIDSSAVVGLMREAGQVPHTFSVGFAERAYDETRHARNVAARFGAEHTEILLRDDDLLDQLPQALAAIDQPTGDGVNTYVVAGAVRRAGITVALSGLGGDELFAGYPSFGRLARTARLFRAWGRTPRPIRAMAANALAAVGGSSVRAVKTAAMLSSEGRLEHLYPVLRQVHTRDQRQQLLSTRWSEALRTHADPYVSLLERAYGTQPRDSLLTSITYAEGRTYMHDVLLRDTDQMSMAHALEVRVPLLDHRLVEYVMALPDSYKWPNGTPKPLLVNSLRGLLPDDIVHRPKQGFGLPFNMWMRDRLRGFCETRLGDSGLASRGIFKPEALVRLWSDFLGRRSSVPWSRVWVLVVLEDWLERNGLD